MTRSAARLMLVTLAAVALWGAPGCVEREMAIDTAPQGALVYLNGQEVGRTPMAKEFTWYGTYDVTVRQEGYTTLKTRAVVNAPWYQWVPVDFLAEILPFTIVDRHKLHFAMQPVSGETVDAEQLIHRGETMRGKLQAGVKPVKTQPARATPRPSGAPATGPTTGP